MCYSVVFQGGGNNMTGTLLRKPLLASIDFIFMFCHIINHDISRWPERCKCMEFFIIKFKTLAKWAANSLRCYQSDPPMGLRNITRIYSAVTILGSEAVRTCLSLVFVCDKIDLAQCLD